MKVVQSFHLLPSCYTILLLPLYQGSTVVSISIYFFSMKAVLFQGTGKVSVETVSDPTILEPTDAIIKVTSTAICGSDLHLFNGYNPTMKQGDILGHEFMGEVVEVGADVRTVKTGDRIVVPFNIACGECFFCKKDLYSACDRTNPNPEITEKMYGHHAAGMYGYSHAFGGYCGGQAQFVRVVNVDVNHITIPAELPDEKVLFLGDIFSTGYMAAENAQIEEGDTVAIWGCGPVGQFCIKSAFMFGAGRVIAIDRFPERLEMAKNYGGAEVINYEEVDDLFETLNEMTDGRGPDSTIDAVGMEAHGTGIGGAYDKVKQSVRLETDRPTALRQVIHAVRKGGHVSVPGVYMEFVDKLNFGAVMNKGLTIKSGQTHVQRYLKPLLEKIQSGEIDPSGIISHRPPLAEAQHMYEIFRDKEDSCIKVVMNPWA